jgi:GNAT superfamily N-acetyltransferase
MPVFPFVVPVSFETVLPIWTNDLWPGRVSPILPVSTMVLYGGYDMTIRSLYTGAATFFGVYNADGELVGVFSGFPTSATLYRARGLYVTPAFQHLGVGRALVQTMVNQASIAGRSLIWCLPRVANVPFFMDCGFIQVSEPFTTGVEFGPNVYMTLSVVPQL